MNSDRVNNPVRSIIVAMARNRVIGRDGALPWHMPADLKHFKATTSGRPMVMGRRTWESIGSRPLPGRPAIVVTRRRGYDAGAASAVANDLASAIDAASKLDGAEVFICGGEAIYREALERDLVDRIYLTLIDADVEGDTRFPAFDAARFAEVSCERHPADERHAHAYAFVRLDRSR